MKVFGNACLAWGIVIANYSLNDMNDMNDIIFYIGTALIASGSMMLATKKSK